MDVFDIERADFSRMTGAPDLYIGHVRHKALIDVNEQATEAAAAAAVIMKLRGPALATIEFRTGRPFFYLMRDEPRRPIL